MLNVGNSNGNGTSFMTHIISVSMNRKELRKGGRCLGRGGGRGGRL